MLTRPSFWLAAALTVATWSAALAFLVAPTPVQIVSVGATYAAPPQDERERFAFDLLARMGNTQPSAETIAFVVAWQGAENTAAQFNPLATSQDMPGATVFNSDGVKNYQTYEDGIQATVITFGYNYSGYADIAYGLQTNDPDRALRGVYASPWGTNADNIAALWRMPARQAPPAGGRSVVTEAMTVSADFYATGSGAWAGQPGGMHWGVDYNAPHGSPVFMPYDCQFIMVGHYDDPGRMGDYLMCYFADGSEYYSGHLENVQAFAPGEVIPAGTLIGYTNVYDHTHVQLRAPGGALVNFEEYYATH